MRFDMLRKRYRVNRTPSEMLWKGSKVEKIADQVGNDGVFGRQRQWGSSEVRKLRHRRLPNGKASGYSSGAAGGSGGRPSSRPTVARSREGK